MKFFTVLIISLNESFLISAVTPDITKEELELMKNIFEDADPDKTAVFISDAANITCTNYACEKYSSFQLEDVLYKKGLSKLPDQFGFYDQDDPYPYLMDTRIKNAGSNGADVFILKFKIFSRKEVQLLDIIRAYNQKSYIMVIVDNEECFRQLKKHILDADILNIYVIKKTADPQVYLIYDVCAFCDNLLCHI